MTVRELYNWCKAYKHKDATVYFVKDWEQCDEEGNLTDLYELDSVCDQCVVVDTGLDFEDEYEVLLEFKNEKAGYNINH